jgi:osmoprotectant transport system permease protein
VSVIQQTIFPLLQTNAADLVGKLFKQLFMVGITMIIASIIGIPVGILATRHATLKKIALGFAGTLQIIPGLALLVFLIPFFGIGVKPAIIALVLYALLPIISSTAAGIENVSKENIEAANGLGFTQLQRLWLIELPLALPTIISGLRIATTITVGTATLAAFIGAGGLGDFINRGLALNNTGLLLLGAVSAALLALILNFLIGKIEKYLIKKRATSLTHKSNWLIIGIVLLLIAACSYFNFSFPIVSDPNTIRIATTNFTEQFILGQIFKQLIENKTKLKVKLYPDLGTEQICFQAMQAKEIDLYPEYTGTAYLVQLKQPYKEMPRQQLFQLVKNSYAQQFNLIWLAPLGFNDTQAIAVNESFAKQRHVYTISGLAPIAKQLSLAAPAEFIKRPDGIPGLQKKYGLQFGSIKEMQPVLMYGAIKQQQVNAIVAFSTDGHISAYHLVLLKDDKKLFPAYDCAPLIRAETLLAHPELKFVLQKLAGAINDHTMQQLNTEVDLQKKTPAAVAKEFLQEKYLIN